MQENPFDDYPGGFTPPIKLALDECCICGAQPVAQTVHIQTEYYPFCAGCEHRATFLQRGQQHNWPALRVEGLTGTYALTGDVQTWAITALVGTDERVVELLDALDEYEKAQPQNAA